MLSEVHANNGNKKACNIRVKSNDMASVKRERENWQIRQSSQALWEL